MALRDLDINLTEEQISLRDTIRKFGEEVMRPAGIELDNLADPADVIAEGSVLWDVYKQYRELGLHKRSIPKAIGGMAGTGLAIVRLDLPGITRGKPLNKIGQRALNQGEIYFDDVKIPKSWMVVPDPALTEGTGEAGLAQVNGGMGIVFAGLAKAAFDEALQYSKERIQGGAPIFEHQNIKLKLFRMYAMVESARALSRRTALYNSSNPLSAPPAVASKILSTEYAFKVASEAIQVFGGNGLSKEYPVEKMFRDARAAMIEDGVNETLSIAATEYM